MSEKFMYILAMIIHKILFFVDYNKWLKRLDTQLNNLTNQSLIKVPKVVEPTIRKCYYKTLGTRVNSPMPLSL